MNLLVELGANKCSVGWRETFSCVSSHGVSFCSGTREFEQGRQEQGFCSGAGCTAVKIANVRQQRWGR